MFETPDDSTGARCMIHSLSSRGRRVWLRPDAANCHHVKVGYFDRQPPATHAVAHRDRGRKDVRRSWLSFLVCGVAVFGPAARRSARLYWAAAYNSRDPRYAVALWINRAWGGTALMVH